MSLEQSIADLQTQAGLLLDLPQEIADTADAKITALVNTFNTNQDKMQVTFYVDQVAGLDTNAGTEASPLKTITKALALTPVGGTCFVRLLSDYHISGAHIDIVQRRLSISGANGIVRNITHEPYIYNLGGTNYKEVYGFIITQHGALHMFSLNWIIPPAPGGSVGLSVRV